MKKCVLMIFAMCAVCVLGGCSGPEGPGTRAGQAVDRAVYDVGTGVKRTGQSIQNAVD